MDIRRFRETDAEEVSTLIGETLRMSNSGDYPPAYIENEVKTFGPTYILERAGWTHFYVACDGQKIVGCGAIGPCWGREDESSLFNVFVLPEYQRRGIGRKIVEMLERDEFFLRAKRIEIPASVTGAPFYRKLGYDYRNSVREPDGEGLLRLEKLR